MKKNILIFILLLFAGEMFAYGSIFSVRTDSVHADTIVPREEPVTLRRYSGRYRLQPVRCTIDEEKESVVFLPDSLIRDTLCYEYTKIKEFAYKNKWTKELYRMFFVNPRPDRLNVMRTQNSEERFSPYAGKLINSVKVKVLPPYGTSVYDTTYYEEDMSWWEHLANKTHMSTAEKVIRRQMTFKAGMRLIPFELVQNEILLRRLDYIDDAVISVDVTENDTNRVDIMVVCKDQLSWGGSVETNFLNNFKIGVSNKNFPKLGHVVNYEFSYRGREDKKWGNILEYKANSIFGSHIDIRGYYRNDYEEKQVRVEVERSFLTDRLKWAGGVSAGRVFYSDDLPDRNVSRLDELFNYHFQDVWLGKSFNFPSRYRYNRNLYITGRFFTTMFNNRPLVDTDTNHLYYNRMDYFASLVFTKIKYYKANLIYDFGRTEYIPSGLYLGLTGGYETSEYNNYAYMASEVRFSHFDRRTDRYYALHATLGSYLNKKGLERTVLEAGGSHISNLCSLGLLKFRFYNDVRYIRGIRTYPDDYLYIEDSDIRGFSSDTLCGKQKLSVSLAATFFMPFIKKGFRSSFSFFTDAALLASEGQKLYDSPAYWGIGVALNLRNDNVVIKNISFRLTFYPVVPPDGRSLQAVMNGGMRGEFYEYRVRKPQAVLYK